MSKYRFYMQDGLIRVIETHDLSHALFLHSNTGGNGRVIKWEVI